MSAVSASRSRIFIVYREGLFAQGMRSLLERRRSVEVVGMERDAGKALAAMRLLKPEVVIVEESSDTDQPSGLVALFLEEAVASRIVSLSLGRDYATIYESRRLPARSAAEFDRAICGGRR
jgi:DNA-binding NarL/FixJ family response regulator